MAPVEKLSQQILVNVSPSTFEALNQIAEINDRRLGYVARELMIRGMQLYETDGRLRDGGVSEYVVQAVQEGIRRAIPPSHKTKVARVRNEGELTDELQGGENKKSTTTRARGTHKAAKKRAR